MISLNRKGKKAQTTIRCVIICIQLISFSLTAQDRTILEEIGNNYYPINFKKSKDINKDLFFLDEILKDRQIFGMGAATHGSSEFVTMSGQFFKYISASMEYKYFAIEADFSSVHRVNEFVLTGKGEPYQLVKDIGYYLFRNEEFYNFIIWMRDYNSSVGENDKLEVIGIDFQDVPGNYKLLLELLGVVSAKNHEKVSNFDIKYNKLYYDAPYIEKGDIEVLYKYVDRLTATNKDSSFNSTIEVIKLLLKLVDAGSKLFNTKDYFTYRDSCMAEVVKWKLSTTRPGAKLMYYVDNYHANFGANFSVAQNRSTLGFGGYLKREFNSKLYVLGTDFNRGSFYASEVVGDSIYRKVFTLDDAPHDSFSYLLSQLDDDSIFIDFDKVRANETLIELFSKDLKCRYITAAFEDAWINDSSQSMTNKNFLTSFDALVFINSISAVSLFSP